VASCDIRVQKSSNYDFVTYNICKVLRYVQSIFGFFFIFNFLQLAIGWQNKTKVEKVGAWLAQWGLVSSGGGAWLVQLVERQVADAEAQGSNPGMNLPLQYQKSWALCGNRRTGIQRQHALTCI
jgi:hypothetical protein